MQKIRAAVDARGSAALTLIGRTDARAPLGLDEAIRRGRLYREAGADVIFVEAPQSRDELARIGREVPGPLMANMVEDGATPILPREELRALGYEYVVYPLTGLLSAARALERAFRELAAKGTSARDAESRMSFDEFTRSWAWSRSTPPPSATSPSAPAQSHSPDRPSSDGGRARVAGSSASRTRRCARCRSAARASRGRARGSGGR